MKLYRMKQASEITGLHQHTLRELHKKGELIPAKISTGRTRYYSEEQLLKYTQGNNLKPKISIGYCRVSTQKQKDDLDRQVERVTNYMIARGYQFEIIQDIGSGINYNKKGLHLLIDKILAGDVEKVVIMYKDRLLRFGFELVEYIASTKNTTIEVIDQTDQTEEQELTEDLCRIITVFSCKLQGKRAKKSKELVKELKAND